nr:hypothetical protein [Tanacetum cinerariifolium]
MKAKAVREKNAKLVTEIELHMKDLQALVEHGNKILVQTETTKVRSLIESLPNRQMAVIQSRYSRQLDETETNTPDKTLTSQDASSSKLIQASEPSSFAATNNTFSSSSTNPMP